ncbi:MAG: hypothetical protein ACLR7D_00675 [Lachnospira eligens]
MIFPCDRCLESVPTKVEYSVDEIVDFSDNAAGEEAKEEKDYIGGYELDVDRLVSRRNTDIHAG